MCTYRRSSIKEDKKVEEAVKKLHEELDKYEALQNTIYSYQIWQRIPKCNLRIQELKPDYFYRATKLIEECYFTEEPIFQNINLKDDPDTIHSVLLRMLNHMKDSTSLIALNEGNFGEPAGVLVLVEVPRNFARRIMSRESLVQGHSHKQYVSLTNSLMENVDLYSKFECFTYLRIYALCIRPSYRHIGLGLRFFETAVSVAESLRIPLLVGIFTDCCLQVIAEKIGMREINNIQYSEWNEVSDLNLTNMKPNQTQCSLMVKQIKVNCPSNKTEYMQEKAN